MKLRALALAVGLWSLACNTEHPSLKPTPSDEALRAPVTATRGDDYILAAASSCGTKVTDVAAETSTLSLAVDAEHIYWASGNGAVNSTPKSGGKVVTLAKTALAPQALTLTESDVIWVEYGVVKAIPKSGGAARTLAGGDGSTNAIASNGKALYVIGLATDALSEVALTGGAARLASAVGSPYVAADALSVVWYTGTAPYALSIYDLAKKSQGALTSMDGAQGTLGLDNADVYFSGKGGISAIARGGGKTRLVHPVSGATFVVGDDALYVGSPDGKVEWVDKRGGRSGELARAEGPVTRMAVDDGCVYFATGKGISRVRRKH